MVCNDTQAINQSSDSKVKHQLLYNTLGKIDFAVSVDPVDNPMLHEGRVVYLAYATGCLLQCKHGSKAAYLLCFDVALETIWQADHQAAWQHI